MFTIKDITMRLYRQHDLDLLYLYKLPGFSLQFAVKKAIDAFISNSNFVIDYPEWNGKFANSFPKSAQIHIFLNDDTDKEAIDWLESVSPGYRNSLLKNLTRQYLNRTATEIYSIIEPNAAEKAKPMYARDKTSAIHIEAAKNNVYSGYSKREVKENLADAILSKPVTNTNNTVKINGADKILGRKDDINRPKEEIKRPIENVVINQKKPVDEEYVNKNDNLEIDNEVATVDENGESAFDMFSQMMNSIR